MEIADQQTKINSGSTTLVSTQALDMERINTICLDSQQILETRMRAQMDIKYLTGDNHRIQTPEASLLCFVCCFCAQMYHPCPTTN